METVELLSDAERRALDALREADDHLLKLSIGTFCIGLALVVVAILSTAFVPIVHRATVGSDHPVSRFLWAIGVAFYIGWIIGWFIFRPWRLRGMAERNAARTDPLYRQAKKRVGEIQKKLDPYLEYLSLGQ